MASKKKESEGIALLSIYGDEDDEMEDMEHHHHQQQEENMEAGQQDDENRAVVSDSTPSPLVQQSVVDNLTTNSTTTTPFLSPNPQAVDFIVSKKRLTIVDYAHDEVNMSPEPEEGEIMASGGRVMYREELQAVSVESIEKASPALHVRTPSTQTSPRQSVEPIDDTMDYTVNEGQEAAEGSIRVSEEEQKEVDVLEKFLPPPPKEKCSEELQEKISRFLTLKKTTGRSFNAEVRNRKEYRNPDFLTHAMTYQDIDQIGSCFSKDVFDPHGYDKSDFYDELEADMKREMERREQERKKSPKVDFISGGTQPATMVHTPKINLPFPGNASAPAPGDVLTRDGRQNKKSKWDKVDVDRRDTVSAHAAALLSANAGAGYTAFAQQRRREAEEKRPSDKKLERRS